MRVLIYETEANGHQMEHIRRLLQAMAQLLPGVQAILLVAPEAAGHPNCQRVAAQFAGFTTLRVAPAVTRRHALFRRLGAYFERQWRHAESLDLALAELGPGAADYILVPHLEAVGLLQLGLRRGLFRGLPWATISMGVRFHHRAAGIAGPRRWIDHLQRALFWRVVRDRTLACFATVDPFFAPAVRHPKVAYCPDPCEAPVLAEAGAARAAYGVRAESCVLLVFGFIDARKCLEILFAGAALVDPSIDLTILVAGPQHRQQVRPVLDGAAAGRLRQAGRLVEVDRYILSGQDIDPMSAADIAWVFYEPGFVYSSSVLVRSAMSGRAVIARQQGVIGRQVETHECGLALDSDAPAAVAAALARLAGDAALRARLGANGARAFAGHTPAAFARPIVDSMAGVSAVPASR